MKYINSLLIFFSLFLAACSSDEPDAGGEIQPDKNFPDPEETVTVSLYKNTDQNIDGIYVDVNDKLTSNNGWYFAPLGEMKGLGNISLIPLDGWASSLSLKKGQGYVAYNPRKSHSVFYRLFVSNSASDEMGTITGYQIKYQEPFYGLDEALNFDQTEFSFNGTGGSFIAKITNSSFIPCQIETDCDWIEIAQEPYLEWSSISRDVYGITCVVKESNDLSASVGHIKVKTFYNKEVTLTVNRGEMVQWEATTSILDLKQKYWKDETNYAEQITQPTIIRGKVVSSDEAGNIFKQVVIDDGTSAISLAINQYSLYQTFPYGQEVAFNLEGLYIGRYQGLMQIGERTLYDNNYGITFAPLQEITYQIIGKPTEVIPVDASLSTLHEALFNQSKLLKWQSRYIKLTCIEFNEPNVPFVSTNDYTATNRLIYDASLLQLVVKTSCYCNFKSSLTPVGVGSIYGILSYYNGTWQLMMNSLEDLGGFDPNNHIERPGSNPNPDPVDVPLGDGTESSPYNVAKVLELNNPGTLNWVEGYIVGYMDTYTPCFTLPANTKTCILIADRNDINDFNYCIPVQLPPTSDVRMNLNLCDNPSMLGKKIQVYGSLEKYFSKPGVKSTSAYIVK